jgi:hypothetical protein
MRGTMSGNVGNTNVTVNVNGGPLDGYRASGFDSGEAVPLQPIGGAEMFGAAILGAPGQGSTPLFFYRPGPSDFLPMMSPAFQLPTTDSTLPSVQFLPPPTIFYPHPQAPPAPLPQTNDHGPPQSVAHRSAAATT